MMADPSVALGLLTAFISAMVPVTAYVHGRAKLKLEAEEQKHKLVLAEAAQTHALVTAKAAQDHQITASYLDRALDQEVPLAIRQQLLRFLSSPGTGDEKLQRWASSELKLVDAVVEGLDREIVAAEQVLNGAKDPRQLKAAQEKLRLAVGRKHSALEPKRLPPPTAAALLAGIYQGDKTSLVGIDLEGQSLRGARMMYCNLSGANLRNVRAERAWLHGCTFAGASLDGINLDGAQVQDADFRGASLLGAELSMVSLKGCHLEGADLTGANLGDRYIGAIYDRKTKWPAGFDPIYNGCVSVDEDAASAPSGPAPPAETPPA